MKELIANSIVCLGSGLVLSAAVIVTTLRILNTSRQHFQFSMMAFAAGYAVLDFLKCIRFTIGDQYEVALWLTIDYLGVLVSLQSWFFAARYYYSYMNC